MSDILYKLDLKPSEERLLRSLLDAESNQGNMDFAQAAPQGTIALAGWYVFSPKDEVMKHEASFIQLQHYGLIDENPYYIVHRVSVRGLEWLSWHRQD